MHERIVALCGYFAYFLCKALVGASFLQVQDVYFRPFLARCQVGVELRFPGFFDELLFFTHFWVL